MQGLDTDIDFWKDIEKPPDPESFASNQKSLEEKLSDYKSSIPDAFYKEKFEKLLNQARIAAKETCDNQLRVSLFKQAKEHQRIIKATQEDHRNEINELMKKFWKLDDVLADRDLQIQELQKFFIVSEEEIAMARLSNYNAKSPVIKVVESETLIEENAALKLQLQALKELIGIYERDIRDLKKNIKKTEKNCEKDKEMVLQEKNEIFEMYEKERREFKKKLNEVNNKYIEFKKDMKTELDVRSLLNNRQQEIIAYLKQDLICAKTVLDTPRLLFKYNSKSPGRQRPAQSVSVKPIRSKVYLRSYEKSKKFDSKATLVSTRASPIFTLTPDVEYPSSVLPTLSEVDYYYR